jgi:hypothetical protein
MKLFSQKKGVEDYMFWLFRFLILAGIVFWVVTLKNNSLSQSYDVHSAEQGAVVSMLYSKFALLNTVAGVDLGKLDSSQLEKVIYLVDRGIAYKIEVFDLQGKVIHGPVYSEYAEDKKDIKFEVYSPLTFDESYASTESEFLVRVFDELGEERLGRLKITTAYKTGK